MSEGGAFAGALREAYAHCGALAREHEKDRWLSALFAPEAARPHLHALAAFDHETARVRALVREPLAGEMRLAWWREALEGRREMEAAAHPVAAALIDTIARFALPLPTFDALLEARAFDLYDDAMPTLDDLALYCRRTAGASFALAAQVLAEGREPGAAAASEAAGEAAGLTQALRSFCEAGAGGPVVPPRDLLERHGVAVEDARSRRDGAGLRAALAEMRALAGRRLLEAERALAQAPPTIAPAFVPLAVVGLDLRRLARLESAPVAPIGPAAGWRRQWALWRWARGRRGV
jgi:phytoene synthase